MYSLIFFCIIGVLWLAWVILIWAMLLLEKRRPLTLAPMPEGDPRAKDPYMLTMRAEAEAAGFVWIAGLVDSDPNFIKGSMGVMVSPDGVVMLRIICGKMLHKIALATALTNDVWVQTMSTVGDPDCTGLSDEDAAPSSNTLAPVLALHKERLAGREAEIIPWSPDELVHDLQERDKKRVALLMQRGHARWRDQMTGKWSYTFAGAILQRRAMKKFFKQAMDAAKAAEEEKKRAKKLAKSV